MNRRAFLGTLAGGLIVAPVTVAQQAERAKIPRVGIMWSGPLPAPPLPPTSPLVQFREILRKLGYIEGRTIEIESRFGAGRTLLTQAVSLVELKVDVIVAMSTPAAWAAKSTTTAVPIVFAVAGDPVQVGLTKSLAHPEGNLTGVYALTAEHSAKRLSLLREVVPRVSRIAMLWNPADRLSGSEFRSAETAAKALNVVLVPLEVRTSDDLEAAFRVAKNAGATALSVLTSPPIVLNLRKVADLSLANRFPAIAAYPNFAELGGLMGYGASSAEMLRLTAGYVDRILKGAKPADLPVQQPTKFELVINLKTAKALGLTIPPSLLQRADQVIE